MLLSILSTAILASTALAAPGVVEARNNGCSFSYKPHLFLIESQTPAFPAADQTTPFHVANHKNGRQDLVASFRNIPQGAWGCQIQIDYKPTANPVVNVVSGNPLSINMFRITDEGSPWPVSWDNTNSRTGSLVGTFTFPSGPDAAAPKTVWINSFVCSPVMTFRFTMAYPNGFGGVSIADTGMSGLRMQYNC
jgi:hypothetical protein